MMSWNYEDNPYAGDTRPIYFVVVERDYTEQSMSIFKIIHCIPCTMADTLRLWKEYLSTTLHSGHNYSAYYFAREPDNLLREMAAHDAER